MSTYPSSMFDQSPRAVVTLRNLARCTLVLVLSTVVLSLVSGCTRGGGTTASKGSGPLDATVLSYLPQKTVAFGVLRTDSPGFARYKQSVLAPGATSAIMQSVNADTNPAREEFRKFLAVAEKLNLISLDPSKPDAVRELALFVAPLGSAASTSNEKVAAGFAATAVEGQDLASRLPAIEQYLKDEGMKVAQENLGNAKALSVTMDEARSLVVAATADRPIITNSKSVAQGFWGEASDAWLTTLKGAPVFGKVSNALALEGDEFAYLYGDVTRLVAELKASGVPNPPDFDPETLPLNVFGARASMGTGPAAAFAVSLAPKAEEHKAIISGLTGTLSAVSVASRFPADTVVMLGLDGKLLQYAKRTALESSPDAVPPGMEEELRIIDSLKSVALGIKKPSPTSPFPEVVLTAESTNASELASKLTLLAGGLLAAESGGAMQLQQKKIDDVDVQYMITPLGVGAFLGARGENLVLASSEAAFSAALETSSGKGKSLATALAPSSKALLGQSGALVTAFVDYEQSAELVKNVQGSLAMFTGGEELVPASTLEDFRKLGAFSFTLKIDGDIAVAQTRSDLPAAAKP